jgi:magnesium-transporting ATPase (P-type)
MISDSDKTDEKDFLKIKKIEKMKEEVLEENFKTAEFSKHKEKILIKEKKDFKKYLPVFGVIFIIIAIAALFIINYLPWMYITYNNSDYGNADYFFYRDFKINTGNEKISELMGIKCDNCSAFTQNYIGLSIDDFTYSPRYSFYGFIVLIAIGLISIIFSIINKFCNFSIKLAVLFYSIFAIAEIIIGVIILSLCVKFLGVFFLLYYNKPLIESIGINNARLLILAPLFLIIFAFIIIKGAMIAADLNFRELCKNIEPDKTSKLFSTDKYRSSI